MSRRNSGRGGSSRGGSSRGGSRGSSRGGSRGGSSRGGRSGGGRGGDVDFTKVGNLTISKAVNDREDEIIDNIQAGIDDGLSLGEILQQSGLQMWLQFYFPDDNGAMKFQSKDQVLVSFKEPQGKTPEFVIASASFNVAG